MGQVSPREMLARAEQLELDKLKPTRVQSLNTSPVKMTVPSEDVLFQRGIIVTPALIDNIKNDDNDSNEIPPSINSLENAANWLKEELKRNPENAAAGATPFLNMFGWTLGGWVMCRCSMHAISNEDLNERFCIEKINTSLFFCTTYLPTSSSLLSTIKYSYKTVGTIC